MVCLIKHFPQERKEAAACGMQRLITNSEPLFNFRLLSFFFLVAALSSVMACFVVLCALEGSSEETEWESSLGIFHSHSHPRISVSSSQITLFMESLYFVTYPCPARVYKDPGSCMPPFTSVECQHHSKPFLPYWCAFTDCKSAYCILKIPHFLENAVFEDENSILTEAYYIKGKKRWERKQKGGKEQRKQENDQVEFCFQVQTADLL